MPQHRRSVLSTRPFRVAILAFLSLHTFLLPTMPANGQPSSAEISREIDTFIQTQIKRHGIVGLAVAVTQDDQVLHLGAYGQAGQDRPVDINTPFYLGSVTKSFTALAVMQLVDAGKIELDAPVQHYLPWFEIADAESSRAITVRDLLNQTSGLSRSSGVQEILKEDAELETAVRALARSKPTAPVGEKFQYFNQNYTTLGLLVEQTSGLTFDEYMRTHIFEPLDMQHTFTNRETAERAGLAQGHNVFFGIPIPRPQPHLGYDLPAGFIISSARDMANYMIAQLNGGLYQGVQLVSKSSLSTMHQPPENVVGNYAMGWEVHEIQGQMAVRHDGTLETFFTRVILLPESELGITILANQASFAHMLLAYDDISEGILQILSKTAPQPGFSTRNAYILFGLFAIGTLGLQVRGIVRVSQSAVAAAHKARWRLWLEILWKMGFGVGVLVFLPWILINRAGLTAARVSFLSYMPDVTLWLGLMAALSLLEGVLRWRLASQKRVG